MDWGPVEVLLASRLDVYDTLSSKGLETTAEENHKAFLDHLGHSEAGWYHQKSPVLKLSDSISEPSQVKTETVKGRLISINAEQYDRVDVYQRVTDKGVEVMVTDGFGMQLALMNHPRADRLLGAFFAENALSLIFDRD